MITFTHRVSVCFDVGLSYKPPRCFCIFAVTENNLRDRLLEKESADVLITVNLDSSSSKRIWTRIVFIESINDFGTFLSCLES